MSKYVVALADDYIEEFEEIYHPFVTQSGDLIIFDGEPTEENKTPPVMVGFFVVGTWQYWRLVKGEEDDS